MGVMRDEKHSRIRHLPDDIVEEILSRLHVKDLVRFRSVCKKWNSIISSARLIQLHLEKSISNWSHHRIFRPYGIDNFKTIDCKDVYGGSDISVEERPRPEEVTGGCFVGTSDGLLCYLKRPNGGVIRGARIWNPATRQLKTVKLSLKHRRIWMSWFGRESSDDEYKLVLGTANGEYIQHIHVIKPFEGDYDCNGTCAPAGIGQFVSASYNWWLDGLLLQGRVHWAAAKRTKIESPHVGVVFYFDLGRRITGEIGTPVGFDLTCGIGVLDGCLLTIIRVVATFEIWLMKEYGVSESWTKTMVLSPEFDALVSSFSFTGLIFVGVTDTGDFIFNSYPQWKLLIYNRLQNKFTNLVSNEFSYAAIYVETLVSPPSY